MLILNLKVIFIATSLFVHTKSECTGPDCQDRNIPLTKEESLNVDDWEIPLSEFSNVVDSGDSVVIDVREPDEVAEVRVDAKEYLNIPLGQLDDALEMTQDAFMQAYGRKKPDVTDEIVFICRSGRRSDDALQIARKKNFGRSRHFGTGTLGWLENSSKVVREIKEEL